MEVTSDISANHAEKKGSLDTAVRRKPLFTYKSPAMDDPDPVITFPKRRASPHPPAQTLSNEQHQSLGDSQTDRLRQKRRQVTGYSPPLYHPFGKLALSLPPLDPTEYGLPLPTNSKNHDAKPSEQISSRLPGNEIDENSVPTVSSIAAVAANEVRRASSRRKRMGGVNVKRKRKEVDDSDATYPAKRVRQSRLGNQPGEEIPLEGDTEGTPEPTADGPAERRRSTRSRAAKRRESSEGGSVDEQPPQPTAHNGMLGATINKEAEEGEFEDGQVK